MVRLRVLPDDGGPEPFDGDRDHETAGFQGRASTTGREFKFIAEDFLCDAGAVVIDRARRCGAYPVDFIVEGPSGTRLIVLAHGTLDNGPDAGLRRTDTTKKLGLDVIQLRRRQHLPVIAVTSHLPRPNTASERLLADLAADLLDVVAISGDLRGYQRLVAHLSGVTPEILAPWRSHPSADQLDLFTSIPTRTEPKHSELDDLLTTDTFGESDSIETADEESY